MTQPVSTNPRGHLGVLAENPPNIIPFGRKPLQTDTNAHIGDFGYDNSTSPPVFYQLTSVSYPTPGLALWVPIVNSSGLTAIEEFTVPFGTSPVVPTVSGVINWPVGNGFAITGGLNSMTGNMVSPFTGNFGFTLATSGTPEIVSISHTSNTTGSSALLGIQVAGTSSGDPYVFWSVGSVRSFALGIDMSNSQVFTLTTQAASSVTPSTGQSLLTVTQAGNVIFNALGTQDPVGTFAITNSLPGSTVEQALFNSSNAAGSSVSFNLSTPSTTGNRTIFFATGSGDATKDWLIGQYINDNSFRISQTVLFSGLNTNTYFKVDLTGNVSVTAGDFLVTRTSATIPQIICQNTSGTDAAIITAQATSGGAADTGFFSSGQQDVNQYWNFGMTPTSSSYGRAFNLSFATGQPDPSSSLVVFSASTAGNITLGSANTNIVGFLNSTLTTVGAAGGASALPITPSGYILVNINGSPFEIPYYARA